MTTTRIELTEQAWPFEVRTLVHDGARIADTDTGGGPTLLLVHSGTWSFIWRDLIDCLAGRFRVLAFDPPAMGLSDTGAGAGIERGGVPHHAALRRQRRVSGAPGRASCLRSRPPALVCASTCRVRTGPCSGAAAAASTTTCARR